MYILILSVCVLNIPALYGVAFKHENIFFFFWGNVVIVVFTSQTHRNAVVVGFVVIGHSK